MAVVVVPPQLVLVLGVARGKLLEDAVQVGHRARLEFDGGQRGGGTYCEEGRNAGGQAGLAYRLLDV
jgi:hypothetical protein